MAGIRNSRLWAFGLAFRSDSCGLAFRDLTNREWRWRYEKLHGDCLRKRRFGANDNDELLDSTKSKLSHVRVGKVPGVSVFLNLNDSVNSLKPFYMLEAASSRCMSESGLHVLGACCCVERTICEGCPICIDMYNYTTCISFPEHDFARTRGYARLWRSVSTYVAVLVQFWFF